MYNGIVEKHAESFRFAGGSCFIGVKYYEESFFRLVPGTR